MISYDLSLQPNLDQIKRMLDKAFESVSSLEELIFHSDQGWQYQHQYYHQQLKNRGIIQSMSRKDNYINNRVMDTFFGRLKNECIMVMKKTMNHLKLFQLHWMNIYIITTMNVFREK